MMNAAEQMRFFMEPKSIAIVGVSRQTGDESFNILQNLIHLGFPGKIYPVNPSAEQILGVKAHPSLEAVPGDIDLAVIATPRSTVPNIVKECTEKGVKAVVVIAQGFADADEEGKRLQEEMVRIAREGGTRIMGPNTFGVVNAFSSLCTALPPFELEKTPIGVICQTGLFFVGFPQFRFGKVIDLGNTCDVDLADALEYFEDDLETKVIALHAEGIQGGRRFLEVARRVSRKKPIVALKTGRSEKGAKTAQSHTGSLTGRDEVYEAAFRQCRIIRVGDAEELEDIALALSQLPPMKGRRLAIMSWAGSTAVMAVDACHQYGLELAELSPATVGGIRQLSPPDWFPTSNPIDIWAHIGLTGFQLRDFRSNIKIILHMLLAEDNADAVIAIIPDYLRLFPSQYWDISSVVAEAASTFSDKPIVFIMFGPQGELTAKIEQMEKLVVLPSVERAIRALARLREYAEFQEVPG